MNRIAHRPANGAPRRTMAGDALSEAGPSRGPVMVIDTYLPRPGLRGAFLAELAGEIHGVDAGGDSRVYRSLDGEAVVVVTEFRSYAEKARWRGSEAYCAQLQRLRPLLEHALSRTCEPVVAEVASGMAPVRR